MKLLNKTNSSLNISMTNGSNLCIEPNTNSSEVFMTELQLNYLVSVYSPSELGLSMSNLELERYSDPSRYKPYLLKNQEEVELELNAPKEDSDGPNYDLDQPESLKEELTNEKPEYLLVTPEEDRSTSVKQAKQLGWIKKDNKWYKPNK